MRLELWIGIVLAAACVGGCGVSGDAGRLADSEVAALGALPADADIAAVREELASEAEAWGEFAGMLQSHVIGGTPVGDDFVELVREVAALAARQKALIDAGEDDETADRQALAQLRKMWTDVRGYLGR